MILAVMNESLAITLMKRLKNSELQRGLNLWPRDALTSWAMKPQMMGPGHLWVKVMNDHEWVDEMIFMKWLRQIWTADMKSSEAMILAVIIYCRGVDLENRSERIERFSTQLL